MRVGVVGHVEWVEFARVDEVPRPGDIVHALGTFETAAGGGAVAAVQLAKLAGAAVLFTSFGDDELGRRARAQLSEQGVTVRAMVDPGSSRSGRIPAPAVSVAATASWMPLTGSRGATAAKARAPDSAWS